MHYSAADFSSGANWCRIENSHPDSKAFKIITIRRWGRELLPPSVVFCPDCLDHSCLKFPPVSLKFINICTEFEYKCQLATTSMLHNLDYHIQSNEANLQRSQRKEGTLPWDRAQPNQIHWKRSSPAKPRSHLIPAPTPSLASHSSN